MTTRLCVTTAIVFAMLSGFLEADARSHLKGKRGSAEETDTQAPVVDDGARMRIRPSGLTPTFSAGVTCPQIASPFGSGTRYDGSARPAGRFGGLHGGIDISLDEGTPLLATAAGKVVHAGEGGTMTGIYLWLQHSPQDTGLPFWVYSKYQHLRVASTLAVGDRVAVGQVIGLSGTTGTVGKHYGHSGYPHLHLTVFFGPGEQYDVNDSTVAAPGSRIVDPVALYVKNLAGMDAVDRFSDAQRNVSIPYVLQDGSLHPIGSRTVWPVACVARAK